MDYHNAMGASGDTSALASAYAKGGSLWPRELTQFTLRHRLQHARYSHNHLFSLVPVATQARRGKICIKYSYCYLINFMLLLTHELFTPRAV